MPNTNPVTFKKRDLQVNSTTVVGLTGKKEKGQL
jgi:hypothetical protein